MAKPEKRIRKANFSEKEVKVLLEEVSLERTILLSSHSQTVTQKRKKEIWKHITEKVSSCGVAQRTSQECKDKWKGLKGAVLNRHRDQRRETGGGRPPSQVPFEDLILGIIGRDSNLISAIADPTPGCSNDSCTKLTFPMIPDAPVVEVDVNHVDGSVVTMGVDIATPVRPSAGKDKKRKDKKRKDKSAIGKPVVRVSGQEDLVDEWLRSEITKNKAIETHLALRNRKLDLQIAVLEKQNQS